MKKIDIITTTRLALEVKDAVDSDPLCGPVSDRARHFIGIEYEIILERGLKNLGKYGTIVSSLSSHYLSRSF